MTQNNNTQIKMKGLFQIQCVFTSTYMCNAAYRHLLNLRQCATAACSVYPCHSL